MTQENKDWLKDFDEWYDSYLDGNGHPPKSSVLGYIIRLLNKQAEKQREVSVRVFGDGFGIRANGQEIFISYNLMKDSELLWDSWTRLEDLTT